MRLLGLALATAIMFGTAAEAADASRPQIWFGMPGVQMNKGAAGWDRIFFQPDAPWPKTLDHVQVIGATAGALGKLSDDQLARVVAILQQHHIGLAVSVLAQNWVHEAHCGHGVEGYSDPPGNARIAAKLVRAQAHVSYFTMDEPLSFGHYYNGKNACHSSIDNVAERVSVIMREYLEAFPGTPVIDTEPFPAVSSHPQWRQDYQDWMRAFRAAVGQPIAGLNIDINWPDARWRPSLRGVVRFARNHGLRVGIIYWGNPAVGKTNDLWLDSAAQNFRLIEDGMGIVPDAAIFVSWSRFPERSISDENGLGEDSLVRRYLEFHSSR